MLDDCTKKQSLEDSLLTFEKLPCSKLLRLCPMVQPNRVARRSRRRRKREHGNERLATEAPPYHHPRPTMAINASIPMFPRFILVALASNTVRRLPTSGPLRPVFPIPIEIRLAFAALVSFCLSLARLQKRNFSGGCRFGGGCCKQLWHSLRKNQIVRRCQGPGNQTAFRTASSGTSRSACFIVVQDLAIPAVIGTPINPSALPRFSMPTCMALTKG